MFFFSLKSGNETCTMHPWFVYHPLAPARVKKCLKSLSSWPCFFDLSSFSIQTFRFLTFSTCLRGKPLMSCIKLLLFDVAIFGKFALCVNSQVTPCEALVTFQNIASPFTVAYKSSKCDDCSIFALQWVAQNSPSCRDRGDNWTAQLHFNFNVQC